jgi:hypothetical protein
VLLANQQLPWFAIAGGVALLLVLGALALWLFRSYERAAAKALERAYAGLDIHIAPSSGDVVLTYHTYHGFIAWGTETTHRVVLPPEDARELLGRLLRYNLTCGMTSHGMVFVPLLAISNYMAQRSSISRQEASVAFARDDREATEVVVQELVRGSRPSLLRRVFGWLAAALCILFAVSTIALLVTWQIEASIGGALLTGLFGWVAHDWLAKPQRPGI